MLKALQIGVFTIPQKNEKQKKKKKKEKKKKRKKGVSIQSIHTYLSSPLRMTNN